MSVFARCDMLLIDLGDAVGIEDAARRGGIGDQHVDIAAAQCGKDRRHLVEATGNGDAQVDGLQHVQRDADGALVERAGDRSPMAVDEATGDDADGISREVILQRNGLEKAAGVDGRVRAQRRYAEERLVGARKGLELASRSAARATACRAFQGWRRLPVRKC